MQWFRLYHDMLDDPKVGTLTDEQYRLWIELLCLASMARNENNCSPGDTNLTIQEIEWKIRRKASLPLQELIDRGLVKITENKTIFIPKWNDRQFSADSSSQRVKKYREKIKSMGLQSNGYLKHRETVTHRDGNCCIYCGSSYNLCLDHILPVNMGGDDSLENIGLACKKCNSGKAGRTPEMAGYSWHNLKTKSIWEKWVEGRNSDPFSM